MTVPQSGSPRHLDACRGRAQKRTDDVSHERGSSLDERASQTLRILIVVTDVSAAYGGPASVARAQAVALTKRGHRLTIVSTSEAPEPRSSVEEGVTFHIFPARCPQWLRLSARVNGPFALRLSPGLQQWIREHAHRFDAALVHFGREVVLAQSARQLMRRRVPTWLQTHGMIERPTGLRRVVDVLLTRRLLRAAKAVFYLQAFEQTQLYSIEPESRLAWLPNGIDTSQHPPRWTRASLGTREVLFVARLHPRKRVLAFIEMAGLIAGRDGSVRFRILGGDGGDLPAARDAVVNLGMEDRFVLEGQVGAARVAEAMSHAAVFVLPSTEDHFPVTVLEALHVGVPCVVTSTCRIAAELEAAGAVLVSEPDAAALADTTWRILEGESEAVRLSRVGRAHVTASLSIDHVADTLEAQLFEAVR